MSTSDVLACAKAPIALSEPAARRLDWRFLLPAAANGRFEHLVLLGATPELCDLSLTLNIAARVSPTIPASRDAAAIIACHGFPFDLDRVTGSLAPGGLLYWEVDRRTARFFGMTPRRVMRLVTQAGLVPSGLWWVIPDFLDAKRFIPLNAPSAVNWYFTSHFRQFSPGRALAARVIRRFVGAHSSRFAPFAPCFSVLAIAPPATTAPTPGVFDALPCEHRPTAASSRVALVTSGQDDGSRAVMVPFSDSSMPRAVVKIARVSRFNGHTVQEQAGTASLRSRLVPELQPSIPRALALGQWNGLTVAAESFAPGPTMVVSSGAWRASRRSRIADLLAALDWLVSFNRCWAHGRTPFSQVDRMRWIDEPLQTYQREFGVRPAESRLFDRVRGRIDEQPRWPLPLVLRHKDLGPWNVHRSGSRLTVIDWESDGTGLSDRTGLAGLDAVYFASHWLDVACRSRTDEERDRRFVELFLSPRSRGLAGAARKAVQGYLECMAIDAGLLPVLVTMTWVVQATDRLGRDTNRSPGTRYRRLVALLASEQASLFRSDR